MTAFLASTMKSHSIPHTKHYYGVDDPRLHYFQHVINLLTLIRYSLSHEFGKRPAFALRSQYPVIMETIDSCVQWW